MKLVFVDECGDTKFKNYLGICVAIIDSISYGKIKNGFQGILRESKWDETIEFKGSHLFSATSGDTKVDVSARVNIAEKILDLNKAAKNARMYFYYARQDNVKDQRVAYLASLPSFLQKILPRPQKGRGKNILTLSCDYRDDIKPQEIHRIAEPVIKKKGYILFENVTMPKSCFHTVGILFADIVGYLAARLDVISKDVQLFENIPEGELQNKGKVKKLVSSSRLLKKIKNMELYEKK